MKTLLSILIIAFISFFQIQAQSQYETGMNKAFDLWSSGESQQAANLFERIASAEENNWLPFYYAAQIKIVESFDMEDVVLKEQQLEKAQELLDKSKANSQPENVENLVMQAMLYTAYITLDPSVYGMKLSGTVTSLYEKALKIAPENPRVVLSKAEWDMGAARFFGEDPGKYCPEVKRSLELFSKFKARSAFYPNWGEGRAKMILQNNCKN
ncbi:hypothetical protein [Gramella sp. MAR_2010_147]|uniref:tetratricopeptide repeat protein n=1 Tax=Gramella sp. MAR_2010_147 TaxID=1250205 RepID=UPI00087A15B9|nr:hypothetical protein [Gramella sp. MAR_2010_147]SDR88594.1 hypothetical protein SAMN04488553_0947 [Gramella sp. MAR_2010_147]